MALVFVFGAFAGGVRFRVFSFAMLSVCLGAGSWAGVQASQDSPWLGLTERISIYVWMLWLIALAASLWGERAASLRRQRPGEAKLRRLSVPPGG